MRIAAHLASVLALVAFGLALGRWLRAPAADSSLAALVLVALAIAVALRRLYRRGDTDVPEAPETGDPRLDLNTAAVEDLVALPGVGPVTARRIVEHREAHGPFRSVDELVGVAGFGPARVRAMSDLLRV